MTTRALIIGASGGIGNAVSAALAGHGAEVTRLSRSADGLDVTNEASVSGALCALDGPFDLVFVATGALEIGGNGPEKALKEISAEAMMDQFALNAIGPALVIKHAARLLPRRERAVLAVLSARVGSIGDNGLGGWYSYRSAKAAVNQIVHTAAIELARTHKHLACVALHPGTVATDFTADYPDHDKHSPDKAAQHLLDVISELSPDDTGRFFDWQGKEVPW